MAPPDETTRQQIINKRLEVLNASKDSADIISRTAMDIVNATPAILCDLCDKLGGLLSRRSFTGDTNPAGPVVSVRQKLVDDAIAAARQRVFARKDSFEACAAKWIERTRRDGSLISLNSFFHSNKQEVVLSQRTPHDATAQCGSERRSTPTHSL